MAGGAACSRISDNLGATYDPPAPSSSNRYRVDVARLRGILGGRRAAAGAVRVIQLRPYQSAGIAAIREAFGPLHKRAPQ